MNSKFQQDNWDKVRLGDICSMETGSRDLGGAKRSGVPSIGGEQITKDYKIDLENMRYISPEHFANMKKGKIKEKDILLVKDGATTGKVGYVSKLERDMAINEHVFILRANRNALPYYIFALTTSNYFQKEIRRLYRGLIGGVSNEVKDIPVLLPPLPVQKQIVKIISCWDRAIELLDKNITANKKLRTGLTQKLLGELSDNHKEISLGELGNFYRGQYLNKEHLKAEGKYKCIHYGQLYTEYNEVINEVKSYTDVEPKLLSKEGDILIPGSTTADELGIAIAGALLEKDVLIGGDINLLRIENKNKYNPSFIAYSLSNYPAKLRLAACAEGTNIKHLNAKTISSVVISCPPIAKQNKIVDVLSKCDQQISMKQQLLARYQQQRKGLIQEFLS